MEVQQRDFREENEMETAERENSCRGIDERMKDLRRAAGRVQRSRQGRRVKNWPQPIRRSALALVRDNVPHSVVAKSVGVTVQTIYHWQKSADSKPQVRELRVVPDSPSECGSDDGDEENGGEMVRVRMGKSCEILIPARQFKMEWLIALSREVQA
jgi:hypothetical protein